jgi:tetratricopeptide (TPR) repeat protein
MSREESVKKKNEGNMFSAAKNYSAAIPLYKEAQRLDPTYFAPYYNCGLCYLNIGAIDEAIKELKDAISCDENFVDGYFELGGAYMQKNAPIDAFATYSLGLEKDATCAKLYFARAQARYAIWKPALMSYVVNQGLESSEIEDEDLLDLAGKIVGDFKAALENGIAEEDRMVTCENIASTYSQIGDHDNAVLYYGKCVDLNDKYEEAYRGLGNAHYSLYLRYSLKNNRVQGIEHLKIAKENIEKAIKLYREKLDLTPEQNKLLGRAVETLDSMRDEFRKCGITF